MPAAISPQQQNPITKSLVIICFNISVIQFPLFLFLPANSVAGFVCHGLVQPKRVFAAAAVFLKSYLAQIAIILYLYEKVCPAPPHYLQEVV
jgi:hypothetical protein